MIKKGRRHYRLIALIEAQSGTPFEKKVWKGLLEIPPGHVRTYQWLAKKIGHPKAARAVGNALKKNPLAPMVPCHRVIASNGIGGYAGGVTKKRRLLEREGVYL